jgi:hypothetical protein
VLDVLKRSERVTAVMRTHVVAALHRAQTDRTASARAATAVKVRPKLTDAHKLNNPPMEREMSSNGSRCGAKNATLKLHKVGGMEKVTMERDGLVEGGSSGSSRMNKF